MRQKDLKTFITLILIFLISASTVSFTLFRQRDKVSYQMYINNQKIGVIDNAARGLALYDAFMDEIKQRYPEDAIINAEVYFKEISGTDKQTSENQIIKNIEKILDVKIPAYAITINDEILCYIHSVEEGLRITEEIKKPYIEEIQASGGQLRTADFLEEIRFVPTTVDFVELVTIEEARNLLQQSKEKAVEHIAAQGETFWSLARNNNLNVEEVMALNPDKDPGKIRPGEIIILSAESKLVNVITEETVIIEEEVPFDKEQREDNNLLKGEMKKIQEGKAGKKKTEFLVVKENGKEVSRKVVKETIIEEPVKEIVAVGNKKPQPTPTRRPTQKPARSGSSNTSKTTPSPSPTPKSTSAPNPKPTSTPKPSSTPSPSKGSVTGMDIVNEAMKHLGKPYVYGASGPKAFDCSGFTSYVYKQFGYSLYRRSRDQALNGVWVAKSDLKPGDLVLFNKKRTKTIGHVGIYIGNNQMIHASTSKTGVIISDITKGSYPSRYNQARRIIK